MKAYVDRLAEIITAERGEYTVEARRVHCETRPEPAGVMAAATPFNCSPRARSPRVL
jgi:hypothetical protein